MTVSADERPPADPGPGSRLGWQAHLLAVLLFAALSAAWTAYSWKRGVEHIRTSDTTNVFLRNVLSAEAEGPVAAEGASWRAADLLREIVRDQATGFGARSFRQLYQESFDRFLISTYRVTGDIFLAYKLLVFPLNLIFLLGAYAFFLRLSRDVVGATLLAVLASLPIAVPLAGEYFGIGPATMFVRRHLMTAFVPWVLLLFFLGLDRPRLRIAAFAGAGLIANLHASGILLVEILLLTWWMQRRFAPRALVEVLAYATVAGLSAIVALAAQSGAAESAVESLVSSLVPMALAQWPHGSAERGIPEAFIYLFYPPHIYSNLPAWAVASMSVAVLALPLPVLLAGRRLFGEYYRDALFAVVLATLSFLAFSEIKHYLPIAVAAYVLGRREAAHPWFGPLHRFGTAVFYVAFAGTLLFQAAFVFVDQFPLVYNQLRAARYAGFFVFAWIALLLYPLRGLEPSRSARIALAALFAIAVVVDVRHQVRFHLRTPKEAPSTASLMDAAKWARRNTPADARILVPSSAFGVVATRFIYPDDKAVYRSAWRKVLDEAAQRGFAAYADVARREKLDYIVVPLGMPGLPDRADVVYRGPRHLIVKCPCPPE